jgi:ABC-type dipeptide/oligopeptide/nickel transport system permease component
MKISYVIKRILLTIFIFIIVMTLNFFIPRLGVEDPAERYYPPQGNMSDIEYDIIKEMTREQYGLNGTTWEQYSRYVKKLLQGDLDAAESYFKQAQKMGIYEAGVNLQEVAKKRKDFEVFGK